MVTDLLQPILDTTLSGVMAFAAIRDDTGAIVDFEWRLVSPAAARIVGREAQDLIGRRLLVEMPGHRDDGLFDVYRHVVEAGTRTTFDHYYRHDGFNHWFEISADRLDDGFVVSFQDVTEARDRERQVHRGIARLEAILGAVPDAVITVDDRFEISSFNHRAERLFGWKTGEMVGQTLDRLIPERYRQAHAAHMTGFALGSDQTRTMSDWRVVRGLRRTGEEFPVLASISKVTFEGETIMTVVARDMTDLLESETAQADLAREMERERERAVEADAAKTRFLAMMSHELRTPLNAIIGFADLMRQQVFGPIGSDRYVAYLEHMNDSAHLLLDLINDILDLTRIESGALKLFVEPLAMSAEIEHVMRIIGNEIMVKKMVVEFDPELQKCVVRADRRAVRQILLNVLSNAVKFSPNGSRILISADRSDPHMCSVSVHDDGPGLPEELLERVGEPFLQADDELSRRHGGSGLGLAICKQLLRAHGGRLDVRSEPGRGTEVVVVLPAAQSQ